MVLMDNFSRYIWAVPLRSKSASVTKKGLEKIFDSIKADFGAGNLKRIKSINSDAGAEWLGAYAQFVIDKGIKLTKTLPSQPQANALVERSMGTWKRING